jgi:hypothetical protein
MRSQVLHFRFESADSFAGTEEIKFLSNRDEVAKMSKFDHSRYAQLHCERPGYAGRCVKTNHTPKPTEWANA